MTLAGLLNDGVQKLSPVMTAFSSLPMPANCGDLLVTRKDHILNAQSLALEAVNKALIAARTEE